MAKDQVGAIVDEGVRRLTLIVADGDPVFDHAPMDAYHNDIGAFPRGTDTGANRLEIFAVNQRADLRSQSPVVLVGIAEIAVAAKRRNARRPPAG